MLDLQSVRLFVLTVEYGNLTRAAEAAGTVQPVVSARIKALEARIGRKLLDRSPRIVKLTEAGMSFLHHAKVLLEAHDAALMDEKVECPSLSLGISDHVLGTSLPATLRSIRLALQARTRLTVRLGTSYEMHELYLRGDADLAVIRREGGAGDGETLGEDDIGWYGDLSETFHDEEALPLVLLPPPCGVRAAAIAALEAAGVPWREAFTGGSCLALAAAVQAGAGVAPLGRLTARGLRPCSHKTLPSLGGSRIVMLARTPGAHHSNAARALAASVRRLLQA